MSHDGGPAFPKPRDPYPNCDDATSPSSVVGMSLRDYFAAKAMQTWVARSMVTLDGLSKMTKIAVAKCSYEIADEMLKARKDSRQ